MIINEQKLCKGFKYLKYFKIKLFNFLKNLSLLYKHTKQQRLNKSNSKEINDEKTNETEIVKTTAKKSTEKKKLKVSQKSKISQEAQKHCL